MRDHSKLRPFSLADLEKAKGPFKIVLLEDLSKVKRVSLQYGTTYTVKDYNPRAKTVTLVTAGSGIELRDVADFQILTPNLKEGYTFYLLDAYLALPDVPRGK